MKKIPLTAVLLALVLAPMPLAAYTVYLKDGQVDREERRG